MKIRVFPDTNVFLHWPLFWKVDWRSIVGAEAEDEIEIVVASVVFYEIEKHKDRNPSGGVRKRALKVASELESRKAHRPAGAIVSNGVVIRVSFDAAPPEGHASEVLARDVADDRIVAAMMRARGSDPSERLVVLTSDRALRMKADAHGFEAVAPPEADRERDDEEDTALETARRQRDDAIRERDEVLNARPRLTATYTDETDHARVELNQFGEYWSAFSSARWDESLVHIVHFEQVGRYKMIGTTPISENDAEEYDVNVGAFLEEVDDHSKTLYELRDLASRTASVVIRIFNLGLATARDASIRVRAVGAPECRLAPDLPQDPRAPKPPKKPGLLGLDFGAVAAESRQYNAELLARITHHGEKDREAVRWQLLADGRIETVVPILHPRHQLTLPPLHVQLPSVAEGAEPIEGEVRLIVEAICDGMSRADTSPLILGYRITPRPEEPPSLVDELIQRYESGELDHLFQSGPESIE